MCVWKKTLMKIIHPFNLLCFKAFTWSLQHNHLLIHHVMYFIENDWKASAVFYLLWMTFEVTASFNPQAHKTVRIWHDCYCQTEPFMCMGSLHYFWRGAIGKDLVLPFSLDWYLWIADVFQKTSFDSIRNYILWVVKYCFCFSVPQILFGKPKWSVHLPQSGLSSQSIFSWEIQTYRSVFCMDCSSQISSGYSSPSFPIHELL